ncbi:hypothetical protein E3U43_010901 [Larimichthys crocea]|uniref:Uncharacterized protein n=1 Tax=Larimichthys crocea TaxID=215358 RepID=A0ACD3RGT9_LARCR|nr:hypothetical protein E3U43_010901 [Larimichthys crocea]
MASRDKRTDHEQRLADEGGNQPEADRDGGARAVSDSVSRSAGARCDQGEGPGACHGGGPGHRSHTERQSTCTRQREERAPAENQSFSSSTRNLVNEPIAV